MALLEGFENGFSHLGWTSAGGPPWRISSTTSHTGRRSAQAGAIGDDEQTSLSITLECREGEIRFWRKVSCEESSDCLAFLIDGKERARWSAQLDWQEVSFPVQAGKRTFT